MDLHLRSATSNGTFGCNLCGGSERYGPFMMCVGRIWCVLVEKTSSERSRSSRRLADAWPYDYSIPTWRFKPLQIRPLVPTLHTRPACRTRMRRLELRSRRPSVARIDVGVVLSLVEDTMLTRHCPFVFRGWRLASSRYSALEPTSVESGSEHRDSEESLSVNKDGWAVMARVSLPVMGKQQRQFTGQDCRSARSAVNVKKFEG